MLYIIFIFNKYLIAKFFLQNLKKCLNFKTLVCEIFFLVKLNSAPSWLKNKILYLCDLYQRL